MGTNYYLIRNVCSHCKRGDERIHLGKLSAGWAFLFRGYKNEDDIPSVTNYEDWAELVLTPGARIENEYGSVLTANQMLHTACIGGGERNHAEQYPECWQLIDGRNFCFWSFR